MLVYRLGLKKAQKPHKKIVCVGNLVAGGTGKTPTVHYIAKCLLEQGHQVVIGCSGYGSPRSKDASLAPAGELDVSEWGDEPSEFRSLMPDVPLIVGRARVSASQICAEHFPDAILLMDDGFQHMPLAKDVSIILDSPGVNKLTFPAGPYREPRSAGIKRADLVVGTSEYSVKYSRLEFRNPAGEMVSPTGPMNVLVAIGRPDIFRKSLLDAGIQIATFKALPDHDELLLSPSEFDTEHPWIVTQKDWVKLGCMYGMADMPIYIATRTATIEPAEKFREWLTIVLR